MPLYRPSILLSDAYGSAGEVTFYHRNGRCFTRRRVKTAYPDTPAQSEYLAVHRRAMAAWASLDSEMQKSWNAYETTAEPHRPSFDHKAHISGNNLFVSAYHGFALMGRSRFLNLIPFGLSLLLLWSFCQHRLRLGVWCSVLMRTCPRFQTRCFIGCILAFDLLNQVVVLALGG